MIIDIPGVSDRRQTPRYQIELAVDLVLADGNILSVLSRNISSSGIQIICDTWATGKIEPRGIQSHAVSHIRLKAITELPLTEGANKLYANCRIMSVQRLSQDEYMLSLAFIDFENGTERILDKLLDQYEQRKTVIKVTP